MMLAAGGGSATVPPTAEVSIRMGAAACAVDLTAFRAAAGADSLHEPPVSRRAPRQIAQPTGSFFGTRSLSG